MNSVVFFFLIVLVLSLTAAVIWALHRNQLRKQVEVVERIDDLPPLESTALPDFAPQPAVSAEMPAVEPGPVADTAMAGAGESVTVSPAPVATTESLGWQDQVKLLKDKGDTDAAMLLCQQNFPKAQAFQQAAVLLRLRIRQQLDSQQPVQGEASKLYRCAVLADLFRSGSPQKPANARRALKGVASLEFPYSRIGHQHLKLLTKGDVKLLEQLWGKPDQHLHADQELGTLWVDLCR